jgi:RNA polymerase sigma-70 factor (ECF subfamily)
MATQLNFLARSAAPACDINWAEVYQTELPRVYNFFRYRVGHGPLAEDLTAQTFEKAWRNRDRYRHDLAAFSTWLFTIARRIALDHYRTPHPEIPLDTLARLVDVETVEGMAQQRADFARLTTLLARLADRDRELVALKYGAGLTNRAIARLSGLSESNVGTILHRVTQQLRAAWEAKP